LNPAIKFVGLFLIVWSWRVKKEFCNFWDANPHFLDLILTLFTVGVNAPWCGIHQTDAWRTLIPYK